MAATIGGSLPAPTPVTRMTASIPLAPQQETRTVCPYCGVGCGVLATSRGGMVTGVRGDPEHPTNRGGLCSKGQRLAGTVRPGDRLLHPMRRPPLGDGRLDRSRPWERVGWDDAMADCARRLTAIQAEHGRDAVAFYLSGQLLTEDYYVANKLVKGFLGTNNVDTNSRLCMASAVAAYKLAFGSDAPPGCYDDGEHATCLVFLGSNAAETHPIVFGRLLDARRRTGARWIVVDPRRTPTAAAADLHLPVTPGTDVPLMLGMLNVCLMEGLTDTGYIRSHTDGFAAVEALAAKWPAQRAAAECAVAEAAIREAARLFGGARATMSLWCQGLNQSIAAVSKNLALINLHLATGQIGRPGTGPFSLTGQANAMGGREVGGMATELAGHRRLANAGDRAEVREFWGSGPIAPERGLTAVELVDALLDGRVRAVWIAGTNPIASLPDGARAEAALHRAELVVVQELFHPTDTSLFADVLLPAAGWAEKTGTATSSERRVALAQAVVPPAGEALPDWRIFAELGRHLGHGAHFSYDDAADVFDEHAALTRGRTCDMSGISHERLRREGPLQWPCRDRDSPGEPRRYTDGVFGTPSGRALFTATPHVPPAEPPSDAYPLRLTTARTAHSWHTLTKTGKVAELRRLDPGPLLEVHPDDAADAGVADREAVEVSSRRGSWRGRARCTEAVPRGTVSASFHNSPLWDRGAWINRLTPAALDPRSLQPELKHVAVRLQPARSHLDRLLVIGGPAAPPLATALTAAGVPGIAVAGWETAPPSDRPWCVVLDSDARCFGWLTSQAMSLPVVVDAAGHIAGRDGAYAAGAGAITTHGLQVTTDPQRLAQALVAAGAAGPRGLAHARLEPSGADAVTFRGGDPAPEEGDEEQGIRQLRMNDSGTGLSVVWRLAGGQALGVEAGGPEAAVVRVARAWQDDLSPEEIRAAVLPAAAPNATPPGPRAS
ncbi:MAG: molybdopterin oxidoreductase family protein [Candidatus Dormibacteria bacterium]